MLVKKLVVSNGRWICVSNFHPDVFVVLATSSNLVLILKKPDSMVELANAKDLIIKMTLEEIQVACLP